MRRTQNILVGIMLVDNTVEDFIRVQDGESTPIQIDAYGKNASVLLNESNEESAQGICDSENDRQVRNGQSVFSALYKEQPCLRDESGVFEVL